MERLYSLRNDIGHELFLILADDNKNPITLYEVIFPFYLYIKIVRWWWKEIEVASDPDMTEEKYNSIDFDEVESSDTLFLREIMDKALSDNPNWEIVKNEVIQQKKG